MSLKTGDKVIIRVGKDKGNTGKIIKVLKKEAKVLVEGINMVKKHLKPDNNNQNGGIVEKEAPIHISNVKLCDSSNTQEVTKKPKTVKKEAKSKKETK